MDRKPCNLIMLMDMDYKYSWFASQKTVLARYSPDASSFIPTYQIIMADQKLIVVLGATGNQGSSVVNTFLQDSAWLIRGVTRNPSSAKAKALSARGVEVVQADMDDISSLSIAFRDANAIFVVSDFWGIYGSLVQQKKDASEKPLNLLAGETELQQLKNAIDAASQVPGLERFILSTLSNVTKWSREKYTHVYHFDLKARASAYAEEAHPELWAKTSLFQAGLFLNTYVESPNFMPRKASHSSYIKNKGKSTNIT